MKKDKMTYVEISILIAYSLVVVVGYIIFYACIFYTYHDVPKSEIPAWVQFILDGGIRK